MLQCSECLNTLGSNNSPCLIHICAMLTALGFLWDLLFYFFEIFSIVATTYTTRLCGKTSIVRVNVCSKCIVTSRSVVLNLFQSANPLVSLWGVTYPLLMVTVIFDTTLKPFSRIQCLFWYLSFHEMHLMYLLMRLHTPPAGPWTQFRTTALDERKYGPSRAPALNLFLKVMAAPVYPQDCYSLIFKIFLWVSCFNVYSLMRLFFIAAFRLFF